jgi:hypothetical protein
MNRLCHDVLHIILDLLDSRTLRNLSGVNQFFRNQKELFYYRHAFERQPVYRIDLFLKDEFSIPVFDTPLQTIMDYVQTQSNLFIAGGFPTQLYMTREPASSSDIDLYVLTKEPIKNGEYLTVNLLESIKEVLVWLEQNFTIIGYIRVGPSVYSVVLKEITHPLQLIVTTNGTPAEILSSFDNSHNRCGIYMGHTYIGMDTKISHRTNKTYFYTTPKPSRYQKAMKLGFVPVGLSETELQRIGSVLEGGQISILQRFDRSDILRKLAKVCAHRNWKLHYAEQDSAKHYYDLETIDIEHIENHQLSTKIQSSDYPLLQMKKPRKIQCTFTIKGKLQLVLNSIMITDQAEINRMQTIRKNLIELGITNHGITEKGNRVQMPSFRSRDHTIVVDKGYYRYIKIDWIK